MSVIFICHIPTTPFCDLNTPKYTLFISCLSIKICGSYSHEFLLFHLLNLPTTNVGDCSLVHLFDIPSKIPACSISQESLDSPFQMTIGINVE
jgi:hypothetical protein